MLRLALPVDATLRFSRSSFNATAVGVLFLTSITVNVFLALVLLSSSSSCDRLSYPNLFSGITVPLRKADTALRVLSTLFSALGSLTDFGDYSIGFSLLELLARLLIHCIQRSRLSATESGPSAPPLTPLLGLSTGVQSQVDPGVAEPPQKSFNMCFSDVLVTLFYGVAAYLGMRRPSVEPIGAIHPDGDASRDGPVACVRPQVRGMQWPWFEKWTSGYDCGDTRKAHSKYSTGEVYHLCSCPEREDTTKSPRKSRKHLRHRRAHRTNRLYSCCSPVSSVSTSTSTKMPPASTSEPTEFPAGQANPPAPTVAVVRAILPRPGQPGSLCFDGRNVTEFLKDWNTECADHGLGERERCERLPKYCAAEIKDTIEVLPCYLESDWAGLQKELKAMFWNLDIRKNSPEALDDLIRNAPTLDAVVYLLRFKSISAHLVDTHELSNMQRCRKLLDGLSERLRDKAIDYCATKKWRLTSNETEGDEPEFDELFVYIQGKADAAKKRAAYERSNPSASTDAVPAVVPVVPVVPVKAVPDPVDALADQFSRLALQLQAQITSALASVQPAVVPAMVPAVPVPTAHSPTDVTRTARALRCLWCDSLEHLRAQCSDFRAALSSGKVRFNEASKVVNAATGEILPVLVGKGGMKILFPATPMPGPASINAITVESAYAEVGTPDKTVTVATVDFEKGTCFTEVIDVDVYEKRRRTDQSGPSVRKRQDLGTRPAGESMDDEGAPSQPSQPPPSHPSGSPTPQYVPLPAGVPSTPPYGLRSGSHPTPQPVPPQPDPQPVQQPLANPNAGPKYRLASKVSETVSVSSVGEKIMESPITLNMRELFAVSSDISNYVNQQTRKHRLPVTSQTAGTAVCSVEVSEASLYACPSSRAKVMMDGSYACWALLDGGSEINIMPRRTFERLKYPIDPDIEWRVSSYEGENSDHGQMLGVCHDLRIDIGGAEVRTPVFVVERCQQDLILGRPWERAARASTINEDEGHVTWVIRSQDGRRVVRFVGVQAEHERNRYHARLSERGTGTSDPLKA
jgi:hypothetical protein